MADAGPLPDWERELLEKHAAAEKCDHAWASTHKPGHLLYWIKQCMLCHEVDWDDLDTEIGRLTMTDAAPRRYRKKPVVIEAVQWDGTVTAATMVIDWMLSHGGTARYHDDPGALSIDTLEGTMTAAPGDWVIKGVKGEFYPCKPDIFAATYELAADSGSDEDRIRDAMAEAREHPVRVVTS